MFSNCFSSICVISSAQYSLLLCIPYAMDLTPSMIKLLPLLTYSTTVLYAHFYYYLKTYDSLLMWSTTGNHFMVIYTHNNSNTDLIQCIIPLKKALNML